MTPTQLAAVMLLAALPADGTNLGPEGYPSHQCGSKPERPVRPAQPEPPARIETSEQREAYNTAVERYNADVERYNAAAETYNARMRDFVQCVQRYVDDAARDIQRVRDRIDEAVEEANR